MACRPAQQSPRLKTVTNLSKEIPRESRERELRGRRRANRHPMGDVAERLRELEISLPARRSFGKYAGAARAGNLVFVSGAGPIGSKGNADGKVGPEVEVAPCE